MQSCSHARYLQAFVAVSVADLNKSRDAEDALIGSEDQTSAAWRRQVGRGFKPASTKMLSATLFQVSKM